MSSRSVDRRIARFGLLVGGTAQQVRRWFKNPRRALVPLAVVASAVSLASCSSPGTSTSPTSSVGVTAKTIHLGILVPVTGAAAIPPPVIQSLHAYWDMINARGGINGRKVSLDIYDTTSTEQGARTAVSQASSKDLAVMSLDRIAVEQAILNATQADGLPSILAQTTSGTPASDSWEFNVGVSQDRQGTMAADFFAHTLHLKRVAVVTEVDSTLQPAAQAFVAEAKRDHMTVTNYDQIPAGQNQYLSEAQKLANAKPQAVWLYMAPLTAVPLAKEALVNYHFHPVWFAQSIAWQFNITLALANSAGNNAMDGAYAFAPWPSLSSPQAATYLHYEAKYYPTFATNKGLADIGLVGWGLSQIVANAIQAAGHNLTRSTFRSAMQHLHLGSTSPVDGSPLLWSPISFSGNVRTGASTIRVLKAGVTEWHPFLGFRSSF